MQLENILPNVTFTSSWSKANLGTKYYRTKVEQTIKVIYFNTFHEVCSACCMPQE